MDQHEKAMNRWSPASGYLHAAQLLAKEQKHKNNGILSVPIYLLLGFHLELMLKAYVTSFGATDDEVRALGHDLKKALQAAKDKGFATHLPIDQAVDLMDEGHRTHAFRYFNDVDIQVADIDSLLPVLDLWENEMYALLSDRAKQAAGGTN